MLHLLFLIYLNIKGLKVFYSNLQAPLQGFGTSLQVSKTIKSCHAELDVHIWSFPDLPPSVLTQSLTWYLNIKMCYWLKVPYTGFQLHNKIFGSFPAQFSIIENSILGSTFIIILLDNILRKISKNVMH